MTQERRVRIVRQPDGSWTAHPQPPLPATTSFVTGGWPEVARLRESLGSIDELASDDYATFVAQYGAPPDRPAPPAAIG